MSTPIDVLCKVFISSDIPIRKSFGLKMTKIFTKMFRGLHVSLPPISTTAAPSGLRRSQTTGAALNEKNLSGFISTSYTTICSHWFPFLLFSSTLINIFFWPILINIYSNVEPFPLQHLFRIFTLINFSFAAICGSCFANFLSYQLFLSSYLRQLFRNLFHRQGFTYDYVFDWNMLKVKFMFLLSFEVFVI